MIVIALFFIRKVSEIDGFVFLSTSLLREDFIRPPIWMDLVGKESMFKRINVLCI